MENIKILAYDFLLEARFEKLPVGLDDLKAALKKQGILLATYSESEFVRENLPDDVWSEILEGMNRNDGISVVCKNFTVILYSDNLSYSEMIHTTYHELGHIKARHKRLEGYRFEENADQEKDADAFAYYTIAPPCVLNEIGGISDGLLARLTGLDENSAKEAYQLLERDRTNRLLKIEKQIILQFDGFIQSNKISEPGEDAFHRALESEVIRQRLLLEEQYRCRAEVDRYHEITLRKKIISCISAVAFIIIFILFGLCIHISNKQMFTVTPDTTIEPIPLTAMESTKPSMPKATEDASETTETRQTVWKAETGSVYHTDPNCYHIPKTANAIDINDAVAAGYRKCKDCQK